MQAELLFQITVAPESVLEEDILAVGVERLSTEGETPFGEGTYTSQSPEEGVPFQTRESMTVDR